MLFNSLHFFVFLIIVIPIYFSLKERNQKIFLFLSSLYFYACLKVVFVPLLFISFITTYYTSIQTAKSKSLFQRKLWLLVSLVINLGILVLFKYTDFLRSIFYDIVSIYTGQDITFERIGFVLPLGISFYTFQAIAYSIDVYRRDFIPERSFWKFSLFLVFFPQLVAGPIMRAKTLMPQFSSRKEFSKLNFEQGLPLIALGIFKKTFIADPIALMINPVYSNPAAYDGFSNFVALWFFTIQIYCDFAGYSDIAIGTGKLLGFKIPINFNRPFLSKSNTELWTRWHISLSTWLRDYVYIPLGGNRVSKVRNYYNLAATMLIGGIWHGAAWTFVLWGAIHAVFLTLEKFFMEMKWDRFFRGIPTPIKILYPFTVFAFGAHFFRAVSIPQAFVQLKRIVFWSGDGMVFDLNPLIFGLIFLLVIYEILEETGKLEKLNFKLLPELKIAACLSVFLVAIMIYTVTSSPQFYYFQF